MLTGEPGRVARIVVDQWPQSREHACDVGARQRSVQQRAEMIEQVVDVGRGGDRVIAVKLPRRIGRADQPVIAPRDHEQDAALGADDQRIVEREPIPRNEHVHALGHSNRHRAADARDRLGGSGHTPRRGPWPGRDRDRASGSLSRTRRRAPGHPRTTKSVSATRRARGEACAAGNANGRVSRGSSGEGRVGAKRGAAASARRPGGGAGAPRAQPLRRRTRRVGA